MYAVLKHLHVTAVVVSFALFVLRGAWMLGGSPLLQRRWVRIVPHVVDTVLLASALGLAWTIQQYPFVHAWLTAKVLALLVYIVLGSLALRGSGGSRDAGDSRPRWVRAACYLAALLAFGYIVSVAVAHDPRGALAPVLDR